MNLNEYSASIITQYTKMLKIGQQNDLLGQLQSLYFQIIWINKYSELKQSKWNPMSKLDSLLKDSKKIKEARETTVMFERELESFKDDVN